MKVHQSQFHELIYDNRSSFLESKWSLETDQMTDDEFKQELRIYLQFVEKYQVRLVLFDFRNFLFTITPDMQTWIDDEISATEKLIIHQQAILMPGDFIAELGIEQTIEEPNNQELNIKLFKVHERAFQWLGLV